MRCKICGWINPNDVEICEKCSNPVSGDVTNRPIYENTEPADQEEEKASVPKQDALPDVPQRQKSHCPNCGYPVWTDMSICPQCKFPLQQVLGNSEYPDGISTSDESSLKKTINPYLNAKKSEAEKQGPNMTLSVQRITNGGKPGPTQDKTFFGKEIRLNKQIAETSETEEAQVVITLEDGQWFIEDKGSLKKTFVLAVRKMPIQEGDILLIDNRQCQIVKTDKGNSEDNNQIQQ